MLETKLAGYTVKYTNQREFTFLKEEIFGHNIYDIDFKTDTPTIVDVGAHIGISILYFKKNHPKAKIIAFEPNPYAYEILQENIFLNNLENVETYEIAIANNKADAKLYIDPTEDRWYTNTSLVPGGWTKKENVKPIDVVTQSLNMFINEKVDLLKIDVEGTELSVLNSINGIEHFFENIIMEYHPNSDLKLLLATLNKYGYAYTFMEHGKEVKNPNPKNLFIIRAHRYTK